MGSTKFFIDDPMGRNMIQVMSVAPLEAILVRTTDITGEIVVDPDNILHNPSLSLTVPVDSLDTGVPLMNEVMRSDRWLDAAKYPKLVFNLVRVLSPSVPTALKDGVAVPIEAEGTFEFHGGKKAYPIHGEIIWMKGNDHTARRLPGDLLRLHARFELNLRDHGIETHLSAQTLGKVSETLGGTLDLFASTQRPQVAEKMLQELTRAKRELGQRLAAS
ncbi:MAG: YceI family protein [Candidatus Rokubacteria bacterium]|nr:YceI family protein [Candidatus Rokubacteria bacterium]